MAFTIPYAPPVVASFPWLPLILDAGPYVEPCAGAGLAPGAAWSTGSGPSLNLTRLGYGGGLVLGLAPYVLKGATGGSGRAGAGGLGSLGIRVWVIGWLKCRGLSNG